MTALTEKPLFRFGLIADPQYAAIEPHPVHDRHYAKSLGKIAEAIEVFNEADLAFVMTLGDLIDRDFDSFDAALGAYQGLRHKSLFLPGNHDFAVAPERIGEVHARLGMAAPYHDFALGNWRFVVLDGNQLSLFSSPPDDPRREEGGDRLAALQVEGAINAQAWNGGIGRAQLEWLEDVMERAEEAGEQVIVFNHYPVHPRNEHNLWDSEEAVDLLTRFRAFRAWFCGHNHAGNYAMAGNGHFVTMKGMVDTPDQNAFAIVSVFANRIEIEGFGREQSRVLKLASLPSAQTAVA